MLFTPTQIKPKSFESRRNFSFFYPGWMRLMLTCVFGRTQTFRRALTASVDSCPFSGVPPQWRN